MPSKLKGHRKHTLGRWYQEYDPIQTIPGASLSNDLCKIVVPYKHRLIAAKWIAESVELTTSITTVLQAVAPGGSKTGVSVVSFNIDADTTGLNTLANFVLDQSDRAVRAAGTSWHLELSGIHANDLVKGPLLMVLVEPIDARTAL